MNDVVERNACKVSMITKNKYLASDVSQIIREHFNGIDVVSLDCFDTILWRSVASPSDVFYDLQHHPLFKKHDITPKIRMMIESVARMRNFTQMQSYEVTLKEIYRAYGDALSEAEIDDLCDIEFNAESQYCRSFQPIVSLIESAMAMGKKVVVVSDTYFSEGQIRTLLKKSISPSIVDKIHRVFVSSEYRLNKNSGLHSHVMNEMKTSSDRILHVGDNLQADLLAPARLGLKAIQLIQFPEELENTRRMMSISLMLLKNDVRISQPLYDPFNAVFSTYAVDYQLPQTMLGYGCLGPIYFSFANYLKREIDNLSTSYPGLKILFLLRDGHLPKKVFDLVCPEYQTYAVRISRFVSCAASFRDKNDIINYISETVSSGRYADIAKQLLLSERRINRVMESLKGVKNKAQKFINEMTSEKTVSYVIGESKRYRERLIKYLNKVAGVENGDTLLFVDLGYSGTAQTRLMPVFQSEYDIRILGRYLISLNTPNWRNNKAGLIDPDYCDDKLSHSLVSYIALLEQLSTTTDRSVVDFDDEGEPIYGDVSFNEDQYTKLNLIQDECLNFAKNANSILTSHHYSINDDMLRQAVIGQIGRLLYFPTMSELGYLNTFRFDLNLGTNDVLEMFEAEKGGDALRRRGLFFMERNSKSMRTNYPAELRVQSLPMLTMLLSQHRHGFEFHYEDVSLLSEKVKVYVLNGDKSSHHVIDCRPTHDGYYSLVIPLGLGNFVVGAGFGAVYEWVQIYAVELMPVKALNTHFESILSKDVSGQVAFEQMDYKGEGLFMCQTKEATAIYNPSISHEPMVLRVAFRPIVKWTK